MVLRPLYTSGVPHGRFAVDPATTFEAGNVGQLSVDAFGNTVCGLASSKPLGLLEDTKAGAFTAPVIAEVHNARVTAPLGTWTVNNANLVSGSDLVFILNAAGAVTGTATRVTDYTVNYTNGIFTVVATGAIDTTAPYLDTDGDSVADSIHVATSYMFAVPGVLGVDTTLGSGLVTLHFQRGEFAVSVYDTATTYGVNDKLGVGDGTAGKAPLGTITVIATAAGPAPSPTRTGNTQCIGICTQPPTSSNPMLQLITDFDYGSWA